MKNEVTGRDRLPESSREFLESFRKRCSADQVIGWLKSLKGMRTLIIGEAILDEYHHVAAIGKPPKGNHIAARFIRKEIHAGGVLACANHMANFCDSVDLVTVIGRNDDSEKLIMSKLNQNVRPTFFYQDKTLTKRRFIDHAYATKLFEVYENEVPHSNEVSGEVLKWIIGRTADRCHYDLVVALDYGHNLFDEDLVDAVCKLPHFLAVNAQTNTANYGYNPITKYSQANYFCLDEWELRLAYHDRYGDLRGLLKNLGQRAVSPGGTVCVTRGHLGAISYGNGMFHEVPVFSDKVVDTTGAGDAFLAVTAPCMAAGFEAGLTTFIGNAVGALAVEYLGNQKSIEAESLYQFISTILK